MNQPDEETQEGFSIVLRGYDTEEVDSFIDTLCAQMDALSLENTTLTDRLARVSRECDKLRAAADRTEEEREKTIRMLDEAIAARCADYNALIEKTKEFKQTLFSLYGDHIRELAALDNDAKPLPIPAESRHVRPVPNAGKKPAPKMIVAEAPKTVVAEAKAESKPQPAPASAKSAQPAAPAAEKTEQPAPPSSGNGDTKVLPKLDEKALHQLLQRKADKPSATVTAEKPAAAEAAKAAPAKTAKTAPAEEEPSVREVAFPSTESASEAPFAAGLHVVREPVGSSDDRAYADFCDRLAKTGAKPDTTAFKQKKYI